MNYIKLLFLLPTTIFSLSNGQNPAFSNADFLRFDPEQTLLDNCLVQPYYDSPTQLTDQGPTNITVELLLNRYFDLNEVTQSFGFTGMFTLVWTVPCVQQLYLSPAWPAQVDRVELGNYFRFWWPKFYHRTSLGDAGNNLLLNLRSDQELTVIAPAGQFIGGWTGRFDSFCDMDFKHFPYDFQRCKVTIMNAQRPPYVQITGAHNHILSTAKGKFSNWDLVGENATIEFFQGGFPYKTYQIVFTLEFKRRPQYFTINLVIPAAFLQVLVTCAYFLPPYAPDRTAYAGTIVLAFYFLQADFNKQLPQTPQLIYITIYLVGMLGCSTFITLYSAIFCFMDTVAPEWSKRRITVGTRSYQFLFFMDFLLLIIYAIATIVITALPFYLIYATED